VRELYLTKLILENVGLRSLQHAQRAALKTRSVFLRLDAFATRLDTEHLYAGVFEERVEQTDGVRAAADAGDEQVGQALFLFQDLPSCLVTDDTLKIPHHHRIRMRAVGRAENVMRAADVRHPIAHCLVHRLLERLLPGGHRHHLRASIFMR